MSYKQKYNDALDLARTFYEGYIIQGHNDEAGILAEIFSELKESEDEKMLREIKRYIKEQGDKPTGLPNGTVPVSDMIAWLEKQDKENPNCGISVSEDERIRKGLIKAVFGILKGNTLYGTDVTREEALAWLEKQGK